MQIMYYNYNMPEPNLWDLFLLNTPRKTRTLFYKATQEKLIRFVRLPFLTSKSTSE